MSPPNYYKEDSNNLIRPPEMVAGIVAIIALICVSAWQSSKGHSIG